MNSLIKELASIGGGVFLSHQGIDTRISEAELWKAFEQPVVIWVHGQSFDDSRLERLAQISKHFPHIQRFRFTNTRVTPEGAHKLCEFWPEVTIEGVAT